MVALMRRHMLSCEGFVRRFVPADDIATLLHGDEVLFQLIHDRHVPLALFRLGFADDRGVAGMSDVAPDVDDVAGEVDVLPAQPQHLAPAHAGEGDDGHVQPVKAFQPVEAVDHIPPLIKGQRFALVLYPGGVVDPLVRRRVDIDQLVGYSGIEDLSQQRQDLLEGLVGVVPALVEQGLNPFCRDLG